MKRNMETQKMVRLRKRSHGQSHYATKVQRGRQLYGPGCCAHTQRVRRQEELGFGSMI